MAMWLQLIFLARQKGVHDDKLQKHYGRITKNYEKISKMMKNDEKCGKMSKRVEKC